MTHARNKSLGHAAITTRLVSQEAGVNHNTGAGYGYAPLLSFGLLALPSYLRDLVRVLAGSPRGPAPKTA